MSIELAQVNRLMKQPAGTDWPKAYGPRTLAYLQTWVPAIDKETWKAAAAPWSDALAVACERNELQHTATTHTEFRRQPGRRVRYAFGESPPPPPPIEVAITHRHIAAPDFARWLAAQGEQPSRLVAAWLKSQGVGAATEPQPAPASEPQSNTVIMKRKALIDELRHQWPTIEADLSEASRNGLSAASVGKGLWDRDKAEAWAKSRGKLKASNVHALPGA